MVYKPRIKIIRAMGGIYNVVEDRGRDRSGKILASFPSRKQAEEYLRKRRV